MLSIVLSFSDDLNIVVFFKLNSNASSLFGLRTTFADSTSALVNSDGNWLKSCRVICGMQFVFILSSLRLNL